MSDSLAVLHKLVSLLRPGWEIRLWPMSWDGFDEPACSLLRPSSSGVPGQMVEATLHCFGGEDHPHIPLWEADLDRLTASGELVRPSRLRVWTLPPHLRLVPTESAPQWWEVPQPLDLRPEAVEAATATYLTETSSLAPATDPARQPRP